MTKQTDNHDWTIPEIGETDWGFVLNSFFDDDLEKDVPLRDTIANRPSAGSTAPALFFATDSDEQQWYYNDDSSWYSVNVITVDDGSTSVTLDGDTLSFSASGAASVSVSDDGDGTATLDVSATDTDTNTQNPSSVTTQTGTYTASVGEVVLADASGGAFTVTLPTADSGMCPVVVKKIDSSSNAVTVATPNNETIDGQASLSITNQYTTRSITSEGSNYYVI